MDLRLHRTAKLYLLAQLSGKRRPSNLPSDSGQRHDARDAEPRPMRYALPSLSPPSHEPGCCC